MLISLYVLAIVPKMDERGQFQWMNQVRMRGALIVERNANHDVKWLRE